MNQIKFVRIGVSGDFFSQDYFNAWVEVAKRHPDIIFYAYTKSIKFWLAADSIPSNFKLTASYGGESDALIDQANLVSAKVVFSEDEAKQLGLEIDHDDSKAIKNEKSFALLLHGGQPAGSEASKAWQKIKTTVGGYSPNKKRGV